MEVGEPVREPSAKAGVRGGDELVAYAEGDGQWRKVDFVQSTAALMARLLQPQLQYRLRLRFRRGKSHYGKGDGSAGLQRARRRLEQRRSEKARVAAEGVLSRVMGDGSG
jgi:hypothetical protein